MRRKSQISRDICDYCPKVECRTGSCEYKKRNYWWRRNEETKNDDRKIQNKKN